MISLLALDALYLSWYDDPTSTITIQWHTDSDELQDDKIVYRASDAAAFSSAQGSHEIISSAFLSVHTVRLTGLTPDTLYQFRLNTEDDLYTFRTLPSELDRPLRFVVGGDLMLSSKLFHKMNQTVASLDPDFCVLGGDIAYAIDTNPFRLRSRAIRRWRTFFRTWFQDLRASDGRLIPLLAVPGNHDIQPHNFALFFSLFAFPAEQLYRAIDIGDYLSLILLDTGHFHPITGPQTAWLCQTLAARSEVPYLFAAYHEGAYPSYYNPDGKVPRTLRTHWSPLFDRYHLQVAFEHHSHAWKETYPIKNNQIDPSGTLYFGDGAWGAPPRKTNNHWYLEHRARKNNVYLVELTPALATLTALDLLGEPLQTTTLTPREPISLQEINNMIH
jgi:hypothetical protein